MKKYKNVEVTEKQLEDLIRQRPDLIEEGLTFVDHQLITDRGPLDMLLVDSGNALVVAELKIREDETMLVQGIDYYDYVYGKREWLSRIYKGISISPEQAPRLLLIAPSFPSSLINRCKWVSIRVSIFTFKCIAFEDDKEIIPVFIEVPIPSVPEEPVKMTTENHLNYITDVGLRQIAQDLVMEIGTFDRDNILTEATQNYISCKISGRAFAQIETRRKHFWVGGYDENYNWVWFKVTQESDLPSFKTLLRESMERIRSGR
jgi:hypothetical protein